MDPELKKDILTIIESSLDAQLRAVRRLKGGTPAEKPRRRGMSQVDMAYDILLRTGRPLQIKDLLDQIHKVHGVQVERESLVSALSKKVARKDRFVRTERNTFGLLEG